MKLPHETREQLSNLLTYRGVLLDELRQLREFGLIGPSTEADLVQELSSIRQKIKSIAEA